MSIATDTQPCIVLLGDSITQFSNVPDGLATKMNERFVRVADVKNRGFSGFNSTMVLPIAKEILQPKLGHGQDVAFMTLWLGANDAVLFGNASRQTVSLPTYVANLKAILALVPASTPKFVLTPPMIQPTRWKEDRGHEKEDRSEEQTGRYAQAVRELCEEVKGAVLVDVWKAMEDYRSSGKSLDPLFSDGLHLTSAGYALVNDLLFPLVEATDVVKGLKQPFPDWVAALPPAEEAKAN